ncbi:MAG: GAF domain-containing protein [Candidatus Promineifilaceae bacterium]
MATTRPQAVAALREIARALSTAWDLDTALALIARKTTEVMQVDSCTIYLLDPDGTTLRLRATTGLARRALGRAILHVGEGMTGYAVAHNRPVYAADAQHDPLFKEVAEANERPFRSLLAVPLVIENQAIGALNVQTRTPHDFSETEVELLSLIADLAAGTLAKAQLYEQQSRQIEELRALAQISEAVTSPQYLEDILDVVTEMAANLMDAAVCSIFLLDKEHNHLELFSAKHHMPSYRRRPPLALGEGIVGQVAATGQAIAIRDVTTHPDYVNKEQAKAEGLVSMLCVPLTVRDRVIGVFSCYTAQPTDFTTEQVSLFTTLANQTALAIENAQLVTNAAVMREMHHRIKNNLQTIAMLMQLQIPEAEHLDTRRVLETNIHRIHTIAAVHEILSEQGFHLVEVKNVLERVLYAMVEALSPPGVTLSLSVYGDPLLLPSRAATALALVVNELVQNALEHAFVGRVNGRIEISLGRSPEELIVLVRDDGIGMAADASPGLGTEIIETLVHADLEGKIKYNRPPDGGTEISLRLPRTLERPLRVES